MLAFRKGDATKFISPGSSLIPLLVGDGWEVEGGGGNQKLVDALTEVAEEELSVLRDQAEAIGLKVHHKAGPDKIRDMIAKAKRLVESGAIE